MGRSTPFVIIFMRHLDKVNEGGKPACAIKGVDDRAFRCYENRHLKV